MNQRTNSASTPLSRFWLPSVLVQSTSWIGVLSLLSGNLALAQTAMPNVVVAPTTQNSNTSAVATPNRSQSATSARLEQLRQKLYSTTPIRQAQPKAAVFTAPTTVRPQPLRQKLNSSPAPAMRQQPKAAIAPAYPSVPIRSVTQPATKLSSPVQAQSKQTVRTVNSATNYSNSYIDPTAYNIGATRAYVAPRSVVLKERSTGCRAVLRQGQGLSGGICGVTPRQRIRVAIRSTRPQAVSWSRKSRAVAIPAIAPVRLGPISINANGFSASDADTKYNGKIHPVGQLSNASTGMQFPLTIPAPITSLFGWRVHPITGDRRFHTGTDLGAPLGTPVLAAAAGNVAYADYWGGYGLTVVLDHNKDTRQTLYGHLSEIFVQPGESVKQGTVIGRVGSTGNSTGPHLHFETRQLTPEGWVATDPGVQLESALAQLVKNLQVAKVHQQTKS